MRFLRPLVLLGVLALTPLAANAQASTVTCSSYTNPCALPTGGVIIGGSPENPSSDSSNSYGYFGGENVIVGAGNSMLDLNPPTASGPIGSFVSTDNQIFGNDNTLGSKDGLNQISGSNNNAQGELGNLGILGNRNNVTSDDPDISIIGTGNTVAGSEGQNWGVQIFGGSISVTASSGNFIGAADTVTNSLKSGIYGFQDTMIGAKNGYIIANNSTINGTTNGTILASSSQLGPDATNSIILGPNTTTDEPNVADFGGLRLTQISNGIASNDGVAVGQLYGFTDAFGAGSSFAGGVFVPPSFNLDGNIFNDTNGALVYLDGRLDGISAPPPPITPPPVSVSSTDPDAVHYDVGSSDASITLQGANGTVIHNLAPGVAGTDAADVNQVNQAVSTSESYTNTVAKQTIDQANAYTDASSAKTLNWADAYTDAKFRELNRRFDTTQAMATAQNQMTASFAGQDPNNHNRLAAGVGFAGGHNGIAVGYQHVNDGGRSSWNIGGAAAGRDRTIGAGMGVSW